MVKIVEGLLAVATLEKVSGASKVGSLPPLTPCLSPTILIASSSPLPFLQPCRHVVVAYSCEMVVSEGGGEVVTGRYK